LQRLDGGLYDLQQITIIITFICVFNSNNSTVLDLISNYLAEEGHDFQVIQNILRELIASIKIEEDDTGIDAENKMRDRTTLLQWSACLAAICNSTSSH
jgi:hypothetical protein